MSPLVENVAELGAIGGAGCREVLQKLLWMTRGSTIQLVSSAEDVTDWDISSSGNFNAVDEATDKVGVEGSMELVDAGTTKGTFVTLDESHRPLDEDWTWANFLCFYVHDDTAARLAGELTFQIRNNGNWCTAKSVPVVSNVDVFEYKTIYIGDIARGNVDGFRFVNQRGTGSDEKVYVQDIIITDIVAGGGDGNVICTGPVIGPILPMRLETGSIKPGDIANLENGLITKGVNNDTQLIGPVCTSEDLLNTAITATATIPKEVWVAQAGSLVHMRIGATTASGDGVSIESGDLTVETMVTTVEEVFARCMDVGTDNEDVICRCGCGFADN